MIFSFTVKWFILLVWATQIIAQNLNTTTSSNVSTSQYNTLLDNIALLPNASMINDLLSREYLKEVREKLNQSATKSSNGHPLTFFVPTDTAIQTTLQQHQKLIGGSGDLSALENSEDGKNYIRALLHLHIVNGSYTLEQAANETVVPTLLDNKPYANLGNLSQVLYFTKSPKPLPTIHGERNLSSECEQGINLQQSGDSGSNEGNTSNVSIVSVYHTKSGLQVVNISRNSAVNSSNGILFLIDKVIPIPPNATEQMHNANLTSFRSLLKATGLAKKINNNPKITILAPSNAALEKFKKNLEKVANASEHGKVQISNDYLLDSWELRTGDLATRANTPVRHRSPITKMASEINELLAFTLSGPVFHLYSSETSPDSDEIASESDNRTLAQFTNIGLTNEDMVMLLQSHIIDGSVLYIANISNSTNATALNGCPVSLTRRNGNDSFVATIESNKTNDNTTNHHTGFIEPIGMPNDSRDRNNATSIYGNVLTQNGVLHIMDNVVTPPGFIANVSQKISQAAAARFKALQYCDSTLKGSSEKYTSFQDEWALQEQNDPRCGQNEAICWVQPELNAMCQTAYKHGPQAFMNELVKSRPHGTCYSEATHVCVNSTTLCPHDAPEQCSGICFNPANYTCSNHFFLCNNQHPLRCGDACYSSEYYDCKDNSILVSKNNSTAARNA